MSAIEYEGNHFFVPAYVRQRVERNWRDKSPAGKFEKKKVTSLDHIYYGYDNKYTDRVAFATRTAIIVNSLYRPDQLPIYRMQIALAIQEARHELSQERQLRRLRTKENTSPVAITVFKHAA